MPGGVGGVRSAMIGSYPDSPNPEWVKTLPNGKLPDRGDFKQFGDDVTGRVAAWSIAMKESERLRDEFAAWVGAGADIEVQPLT